MFYTAVAVHRGTVTVIHPKSIDMSLCSLQLSVSSGLRSRLAVGQEAKDLP